MATKDPVLLKEKEILKEKGKIEAIKYLSSEALKHPQFSELFYKYYFRSIQHSIGLPELKEQVENSLIGFLEYYENRKEFPNEYQKLCDLLFDLYVSAKDGNKAKQTASRLNYVLASFPSNYLLIYMELLRKSQIASNLFNVNQKRKDTDHLYYMIMIQLINISWHLNCDWSHNMDLYCNHLNYPKIFEPIFVKFDVYNNIKWEIDEDLLDRFNETEIGVFERTIQNSDIEQFIRDIHNLCFVEFPQKLGFNLKFLETNFDNQVEFGEWFFDEKNFIGKYEFSSKAVSLADNLTNNFLKKYISK